VNTSLDDLADEYRKKRSQPDDSRQEKAFRLADAQRRGDELFVHIASVLTKAGLRQYPVVAPTGKRFGAMRYSIVRRVWNLGDLRLTSDGRVYAGGSASVVARRTRPTTTTSTTAFELAIAKSTGLAEGTFVFGDSEERRFVLEEDDAYGRGLKVTAKGELIINDGWNAWPLEKWLDDKVRSLLKS